MAQCETTQVREQGKGASLFGYTSLYGSVPGGQAEYLRVPQAQFGPIVVPEGVPDERYLYLSDILPTAWQAVEFAEVGEGDTLAVHGLGPVGLLAARIAKQKGCRVIGVDLVPERLALAAASGVEAITSTRSTTSPRRCCSRPAAAVPTARVDAVGMEAHGSPLARPPSRPSACCPTGRRSRSRDKARDRPDWPRSSARSSPSAAAARSRWSGSTAARSTRCR